MHVTSGSQKVCKGETWEISAPLYCVVGGDSELKRVLVESECRASMDLVLVIDLSVRRQEHLLSRDLAVQVVYGVDVRSGAARVGIVSYSSMVVDQTYLGDQAGGDKEALINSLRLHSADTRAGNTATALNAVRTEQLVAHRGSRTNVPKASDYLPQGGYVFRGISLSACLLKGLLRQYDQIRMKFYVMVRRLAANQLDCE